MAVGAMDSIMTIVTVQQIVLMPHVATVVKIIPYALLVVTTVALWLLVKILQLVPIVHPDV